MVSILLRLRLFEKKNIYCCCHWLARADTIVCFILPRHYIRACYYHYIFITRAAFIYAAFIIYQPFGYYATLIYAIRICTTRTSPRITYTAIRTLPHASHKRCWLLELYTLFHCLLAMACLFTVVVCRLTPLPRIHAPALPFTPRQEYIRARRHTLFLPTCHYYTSNTLLYIASIYCFITRRRHRHITVAFAFSENHYCLLSSLLFSPHAHYIYHTHHAIVCCCHRAGAGYYLRLIRWFSSFCLSPLRVIAHAACRFIIELHIGCCRYTPLRLASASATFNLVGLSLVWHAAKKYAMLLIVICASLLMSRLSSRASR